MKWLWIEFGCECLDPLLVDPHPTGAEGMPNREIFEISRGNSRSSISSRVRSTSVLAFMVTKGACHRDRRSLPLDRPPGEWRYLMLERLPSMTSESAFEPASSVHNLIVGHPA
jgi:hypothetical protein